MNEQWDRYNLAARLEKFGDRLMAACEQGEAIENRIDVCAQTSAVCRITMTLRSLRAEARRADPDAGIAGSAVRKYTAEFGAPRRAAGAGDDAVDDAADPFADPAEE